MLTVFFIPRFPNSHCASHLFLCIDMPCSELPCAPYCKKGLVPKACPPRALTPLFLLPEAWISFVLHKFSYRCRFFISVPSCHTVSLFSRHCYGGYDAAFSFSFLFFFFGPFCCISCTWFYLLASGFVVGRIMIRHLASF